MSIEVLLATWGYLAVAVGVFLEGEAVVMTAGWLAGRGSLDLGWVMAAALIGSVVTYQFFFLLGKTRGAAVLANRPQWAERVERVQAGLARNHVAIILGYRLFFGLRSVTPFALGMSGISYRRFAVLDAVPAIAWSVGVPYLGYHLGRAVQVWLADLGRVQWWASAAAAAAVVALFLVWRLRQRRAARA